MARTKQSAAGRASAIACARCAVHVAMPHRRGKWLPSTAIAWTCRPSRNEELRRSDMADRTRCRHTELFTLAQRHASVARRLEDMAPNRPELERERLTRHLGELIAALN